jgi:hypothetical protein
MFQASAFREDLSETGDESGQAVVEYVLLLGIVVSIFLVVMRGLGRMGVAEKLMGPLNGSFAATYRFGHPQGVDYPAPKHPRSRLYIEVRR